MKKLISKKLYYYAIEKQDIEIIQLLLSNNNIDPNNLYYYVNCLF